MSESFRLLPQFAQDAPARFLERRLRVRPKHEWHFPGEDLAAKFGRALCAESATSIKEILEAFEFFQVVRKFVAGPHVVDLCSGHGLVGALLALFERRVEKVTLIDRAQPESAGRILAALDRVGPWARPKLRFQQARLVRGGVLRPAVSLPEGASIVAVHACGALTDRAIALGLELGGPIAVLPCCRQHRDHPAPEVLKRELGGDLAIDVHRTYRLHEAGYQVRWKSIPSTITPMNRVLVGVPRSPVCAPGSGAPFPH